MANNYSGSLFSGIKLPIIFVGCGSVFFLFLFGGGVAFGTYVTNMGAGTPAETPTTPSTPNSGISASCGQKMPTQNPPLLTKCNGVGGTTKEKSSNGFYRRTTFGCSGKYEDSGDNCIPSCPLLKTVTKTTGEVTLKSSGTKGTYEKGVEYFAANRDQFPCGTKLKVTNPKTGKAVVVVVIDRGPSCTGAYQDTKGLTIDISNVASDTISSPSIVKVEAVAKDTAIGPVAPCTASTGLGKVACAYKAVGGKNIIKNINGDAQGVEELYQGILKS